MYRNMSVTVSHCSLLVSQTEDSRDPYGFNIAIVESIGKV